MTPPLGEPYLSREWKIVVIELGLFGLLAMAAAFVLFPILASQP